MSYFSHCYEKTHTYTHTLQLEGDPPQIFVCVCVMHTCLNVCGHICVGMLFACVSVSEDAGG